MMTDKVNKIVVVSLCEGFTNKVCKALADSLGMMFCGVSDLLEYEIIDKDAVKNNVSLTYLKQLEKKAIKQASTFENICVAISYEQLVPNISYFKDNSLIVFVDLPKTYIKQNAPVDYIRYNDRKEELEKISH